MKTDEYYMEIAIAQARQARNEGELPFGAVVMCNGEVISQNRCREATEKTVLAHAELHALNDACKALDRTNLSDCIIYSTNEPCLMCAAAIFQARIPRIVIGAARRDLPHLLRPRKFRIEHLVIGNDALGRIASEVEHRPLVTLGIALGVGVLIGLLAHGVSAASRPINRRESA
jgi:tRNA(Arg) A34 adenosine deaminase TadA